MRLALALTFASLLTAAACGDSTADPQPTGNTICEPGDTVFCPCPDGSGKQGKRRCSATGRSFGPCAIDCGSDVRCDPGLTDPCVCPDGSLGAAVCLEDGVSYGDCEQCGSSGGSGGSGQGGEAGSGATDPADICPGVSITLSPDASSATFKNSTKGAGSDSFGSLICASTVRGDHVYTIDTTTLGQLTARLTPQGYDGALYLRGDCNGDQLICTDAATDSGAETLTYVLSPGVPYHLFVDGSGEGPYTLDLSLATEWCGDGKTTKPEACDDGNTTAGDGCAPDCTVEQNPPDVACPGVAVQVYKGQPPLVLSGSTKGYSNKFQSPGEPICFDPTGETSPDRVYRVVTDATGTLKASIVSRNFDSLIYTRQGACDVEDPEGLCKDLVDPDQVETVNVPVTAGKPTWIIIDGYSPAEPEPGASGTFALELSVL